ncbi:MAG: efflux RND transporter periplasmic adaptor subunit [Planctomycetales bacterium]|nr:efflux RND transporter periplasmic adaptor subunit [Planctomycetales bacterium]
MRKIGVALGSVALILVTAALLVGLALQKYRQLQAAANSPPPPEMPISVVVAETTELTYRPTSTAIGTVVAARSIVLSNELAGTVSQVHFESGQIVEQGQVLVELDTSVERAQQVSAEARLKIAQSTFARIREAALANAVTASELEIAESELSQAAAQVQEIKAIIDRKTLTAPFRAKIGICDTHVGQFLPSGYQIASLQSQDPFVYVDFMVPQIVADQLEIGQMVQMTLGDQQEPARLVAMNAQADARSRNRRARASLENASHLLVPGDSVRVVVPYGQERKTAAVPVESLRLSPLKSFVYVVSTNDKNETRVRERSVVAGPSIGNLVSVVSGVELGETVVADGAFKLRDGALVAASPLPGYNGRP